MAITWYIDDVPYDIPDKVYDSFESSIEDSEEFEKALNNWVKDAIDKGKIYSEELEITDAKAKKAMKGSNIHGVENRQKAPNPNRKKPKPNQEKVWILEQTKAQLSSVEGIENLDITNPQKTLEFDIGDSHYTLSLIKKNKALAERKGK